MTSSSGDLRLSAAGPVSHLPAPRRGRVLPAMILCGLVAGGLAAGLWSSPSAPAAEAAEQGTEQQAAAAETDSSKKSQLTPEEREASQEALAEFNSLVGGWRGVGMPQRGSRKGAWLEKANWVWDFSDGVALKYQIDNGKLLETASLTYNPATKTYHLRGKFADEEVREYSGQLEGKKLTLESSPDEDGYIHQMVITRLNSKRTLVLHQRRRDGQQLLMRVAEVGYTREGTSLAVEGAGEPECVVTGGKGTTAVTYKGQTYYVCCTGCRQAFDEDPEGVIAEYKRKLAKRKKEASGG